MKICIAQTKSLKGEVSKNIENHLRIVEAAVKLKADLIIFPELSITGYEPDLAQSLATNIENNIFDPFQALSDKSTITIGVGMPIYATDGINISMLIFQPNQSRVVNSKQLLHKDEMPYFTSGKSQVILSIKNHKIAFGICYESLQRPHFLKAKQKGADIYIASAAKPKAGIEKAYNYYPTIAKEFNTPVLLSNCVGYCDNFLSLGNSAIWNEKGKLLEYLNTENQGILVYDLDSNSTEKQYLTSTFSEKVG